MRLGRFNELPVSVQMLIFTFLDFFSLIKLGHAFPDFQSLITSISCKIQNGDCSSVSVNEFRAFGCQHGNTLKKLTKDLRTGKICLCCGLPIVLEDGCKSQPNSFISIRWPDISTQTTRGKGRYKVVTKNSNWRRFRVHDSCVPEFVSFENLLYYNRRNQQASLNFTLAYVIETFNTDNPSIIVSQGDEVGFRSDSGSLFFKRDFYLEVVLPHVEKGFASTKELEWHPHK